MLREIIAEIGQNHNGSMDEAKRLIDSAKEFGADVAKFQLYDANKLFPKENNPWFEYNCKTELSKENVQDLFDHCNNIGIEFMSSVFDTERLHWLEELGVKRHKVASRSINELPLIEAILNTNKPTYISLGQWKSSELPRFAGFNNYYLMHCISKYPASLESLKLGTIDFGSITGFSDHSAGISAACTSFVMGSKVLEKHFTLDKNNYGPDHVCSMDPVELKAISSFKNDLSSLI